MAFQEVPITGIAFSLYSTQTIREMSVVEVRETKGDKNTVYDLAFGPPDSRSQCQTCSLTWNECPGHFGHIELPRPIINPLVKPITLMILNCVCIDCAKLMTTREELEAAGILRFRGTDRLKKVKDYIQSKGKSCEIMCEDRARIEGVTPCRPRATFTDAKKDQPHSHAVFYSCEKGRPIPIDITKVQEILAGIDLSDAELMGFDISNGHLPLHHIMEALLVLPISVRPDTIQGNKKVAHDLTKLYNEVVSACYDYRMQMMDPEISMTRIYDSVLRLLINPSGSSPAHLKNLRSISDLLSGKEGIIRVNVMGKTVDFSARAVIGPGHKLKVNEIGVPRLIARKLTRPITATAYNIDDLQREYDQDRVKYITMNDTPFKGQKLAVNSWFKLRFGSGDEPFRIKAGYIVERELKDGDMVIANRQPTLIKANFIGLRTKIIDEKIIRINLAITPPQNADFDGDEMNLYLPQTVEAYAEMEQLLSVEQLLIDQRSSSAIIALTYDTLLGCYYMSRPDRKTQEVREIEIQDQKTGRTEKKRETVIVERYALFPEEPDEVYDDNFFFNAISPASKDLNFEEFEKRVIRNGVHPRSGRAIFSASLPEEFYFETKREGNPVLIREGVLIYGQLNKSLLGGVSAGIVVEMRKQIGARETVDWMSMIQFISNTFMNMHGFSIGLIDAIPQDTQFLTIIDQAFEKADRKIQGFSKPTNEMSARRYEQMVDRELKVVKGVSEKALIGFLTKNNAMQVAIDSGARGNSFNVLQIAGILGQQCVGGKRIEKRIPFGRTLSSYPFFCDSPESQGFCRDSFGRGLKPSQLFSHMEATRDNMTDTSQSSAASGQISRQLVKSFEDVVVGAEGSVNGPDQVLVQPVYGFDGFNPGEVHIAKLGGREYNVPVNMPQLCARLNHKYLYL
jgi:DNA-directed RNA polymerase II subunit RPB1